MDRSDRYQITEPIAKGDFATVYRGRDLELARDVAIKQIHQQYLEDPLDFLVAHGFAHKIERLNAFVACLHPDDGHRPAFLICRGCRTVVEAVKWEAESDPADWLNDSPSPPERGR